MAIVNKSRSSRLEMLHKNIYSENFGKLIGSCFDKISPTKKGLYRDCVLGNFTKSQEQSFRCL